MLTEVPQRRRQQGENFIIGPGDPGETVNRAGEIALQICAQREGVETSLRRERVKLEGFRGVALTLRDTTMAGQGEAQKTHAELIVRILRQRHIGVDFGRIEVAVAVELRICKRPVGIAVGGIDRDRLSGGNERLPPRDGGIGTPIAFILDHISDRQFCIGGGEARLAGDGLAQQGSGRKNAFLAAPLLKKESGFHEQIVRLIVYWWFLQRLCHLERLDAGRKYGDDAMHDVVLKDEDIAELPVEVLGP